MRLSFESISFFVVLLSVSFRPSQNVIKLRERRRIHHEGHEEREEKISFDKLLRELRALRGEKNPYLNDIERLRMVISYSLYL